MSLGRGRDSGRIGDESESLKEDIDIECIDEGLTILSGLVEDCIMYDLLRNMQVRLA